MARRGAEYRFGPFGLDAASGLLTRNGEELSLSAKPLALLIFLIENRDRVVTARELREGVWPGVSVSESAIASALRDLRRALGDEGRTSRWIATYRGRGYRFVSPLEPERDRSTRSERNGFVGRSDLLAEFEALAENASNGRGSALLLRGEAGIGKTRTARELARMAAERGFTVAHGRCSEDEGAPPLWPWTQILREQIGEGANASGERFDAAADFPARLLLETEGSDGNGLATLRDPSFDRFRLFDAVSRLLVLQASDRPLLLVLDDLHRADEASVLLLRHLIGAAERAPLMVVGALRPAEAASTLGELLGSLHSRGRCVDLDGLPRPDVSVLVGNVAGGPASNELVAAIHERTGGNPLFIEEVTRFLLTEGALTADDAPARAADAAPAGLREAIRSRLDQVGHAEVLEVAAVIGREFDQAVLESAYGDTDRHCVTDSIDDALAVHLIERNTRPDRFRFHHALVRDALYDALPASRRAELHRAVGIALEKTAQRGSENVVAELAHHFREAQPLGEHRRAFRYARKAGEVNLARMAYEEASTCFRQALEALEHAPPEDDGRPPQFERGEVLVLLARALWLAGHPDSARGHFAEAAALARATDSGELLASAALGYAGRTDASLGVNEPSVSLMQEALEALPEDDSPIRAELLARLGSELYYDRDAKPTDRCTRQAVAMAERIGDRRLLAYTLSARHYSLMRPGIDPRRRLALLDRLMELAKGPEALDVQALGLQERIVDCLELGDMASLDAALRTFGEVVETLHQPFFRWMHLAYQGMRALVDGRLHDAETRIHETLAVGQELGSENALPMFSGQLFCLRRLQGRLDELEPALRAGLADNPGFAVFRAGLAVTYAQMERMREARDQLERIAAHDFEELPRDQQYMSTLACAATACAAVSDEHRARQIDALLEPLDGTTVVVAHGGGTLGAVAHFRAALATALGEFDAAESFFEAACSLEQRMGARLLLARSREAYARMLVKRGSPGDRQLAGDLVEDVTRVYDECGLESQAEAARSLATL